MSNKLALVLSGGFVKGAAHISIAEEMYKRDYVPDIFVGTSIGAIFAVLLGLYDDLETVKDIALSFTKRYIWPQLLDFDPFSKAGLMDSKEAVKLIAKEAGFTGKTFNDLKKPVYVTATDLNTGKLVVFGAEKHGSLGPVASSHGKNTSWLQSTGYRLLTEALEASISFPVIFKPKKMRVGNKILALADGGIRENCPISVAARIQGVKRIIACDLGYPSTRRYAPRSGRAAGDMNDKNIFEVFMRCLDLTTSFSQINRYINDDAFLKNKIAVRIINPGIFDVHPFDFKEIPSIMNRAAKTAQFIFSRFKAPYDFFKYWQSDPFDREYMTMEHIGKKRTNAFQIVDFS